MSTLWIILGTGLIGFGGWLATLGWNQKSTVATRAIIQENEERAEAQRRTSILYTVGAEMSLNWTTLRSPHFTEQDDEKLAKLGLLPRFDDAALTAAFTSGAFSRPEDSELRTRITQFYKTVKSINEKIAATNNMMITLTPSAALPHRKSVRDGRTISDFREDIVEFSKYLIDRGLVSADEVFYADIPTKPPTPDSGDSESQ